MDELLLFKSDIAAYVRMFEGELSSGDTLVYANDVIKGWQIVGGLAGA